MARRARRAGRRTPGAVRGGIARDERSVLFGGARRRRLAVLLGALAALAVLAATLLVVRPALARVATDVPRPVSLPVPTASPLPTPPPAATPLPTVTTAPAIRPFRPVHWHRSRALGAPWGGRLVRGVQLPAQGLDWFTYDWQLRRSPNRGFRRWGTDALVRTVVGVLAEYRYDDPLASRVGVADMSRTHGGSFGRRYGGIGHASHQNGLDVDVLYPRRDGREAHADHPWQVDRARAQDIVDRFVAAGAQFVFVGRHAHLHGPPKVVQALPAHDDHLHVRILPPRRR